jgi:uncharacterized protein
VNSCLYEGSVRHRHVGNLSDEFHYPLFMVYLDLDELPGCFEGTRFWSARGPALAWFRRSDYLGSPDVPLSDAVRELVKERIGVHATGPIRLLTHLRYFGVCFNPVSFYYCFSEDDSQVVAVIADVTNTPWGERHSYVMPVDRATDHGTVKLMRASFAKQLHVSPLMGMDHTYDWRLTEPGRQLLVHIESDRAQRKIFDATLSLHRREMTPHALRATLIGYPLITSRILIRIYAHALRLRLRGVSYFPHPGKTGIQT